MWLMKRGCGIHCQTIVRALTYLRVTVISTFSYSLADAMLLLAAIPLPEGITLPADDLDDPQQTQPAPEKWLDLGLGPIQ